MTVEIKELVVRAVVVDRRGQRVAATSEAAIDQEGRDQLVEECVRRVLRALERRGER